MKKQAWLILCIIALIAGLALAATNMVTAGPIEEQRVKAIQAAREAVFPAADSFEKMSLDANASVDSMLAAKSGSDTIGYVIQITVAGYGGPIEIIMGVDLKGVITGLSVGGSKFAETAGLGTQVKEPAFTDQFVGLAEMPTLNGNVDTISGATISSSAVINGVIKCYQQWEAVAGAGGGDATKKTDAAAPSNSGGVFIGEAIGYNGPIRVSVTKRDGAIFNIEVLEQNDTDALFSFAQNAIVPAVIANNDIQGVDTVTGATYSSQGLLDAISDALNQTSPKAHRYQNGVYEGSAKGYYGPMRVSVTISDEGVTSVEMLENHDNSTISTMAIDTIVPDVLLANTTSGVDAVAGATSTSESLLEAIADALNKAAVE